ncbi:hypothetical protein AMTR_s00029p00230590 [Amborella trichopoda]|uniref:Uncharacterized protein n=1 Tax=Amborella trichopoda TaxID=13333 RepID=W1PR84_AMBTC|nr:hypothetical protein AMTR_s00029p00230590 [Amborella trichopoda]
MRHGRAWIRRCHLARVFSKRSGSGPRVWPVNRPHATGNSDRPQRDPRRTPWKATVNAEATWRRTKMSE